MMWNLCGYLALIFGLNIIHPTNALTTIQQYHHQYHNHHLHSQSHSATTKIGQNHSIHLRNGKSYNKFQQHHQHRNRLNENPSQNTRLHNVNAYENEHNRFTATTKSTGMNPLKLTLIKTNGNYPHLDRWPISPKSMHTKPSMMTNDFGIKWKSTNANDQFIRNFQTAIDPMPTKPPQTINKYFTKDHRIHLKHHSGLGRNVCIDHKSSGTGSTDSQQYKLNRHISFCKNGSQCENSRYYYDNMNTISSRRSNHVIYSCCPGWAKITKHSHGCAKPICKIPCENNGKCVAPEQCTCSAGYSGTHCELDIDECIADKPCDQMCHNTEGSFYCTCRLGFVLHSDRQSCRKIDSSFGNDDTGTAFEARDLENDVDNENSLAIRIGNIEKLMITEKERNMETNKLMHHSMVTFNNIKQRLDLLENRQHELSLLRERLKSFEIQAHKLSYTVDLLYKCRHKPLIYCP